MKTYELVVTKTIFITVEAENYEAAQEAVWTGLGDGGYDEMWHTAGTTIAYESESDYADEDDNEDKPEKS